MVYLTTLKSIQASVNSKLVYKRTPISEDVIRSAFSGRIQSSAKDLLAEFQESTNKASLISKIKTVDGDLYKKVATLSTSNEQQAVQEAVKGLIELAKTEEISSPEPEPIVDNETSESNLPDTEPAVTDEEIKDATTALASEEVVLPQETEETEAETTEENLESSSNVPPGESIRSGFYNTVNLELKPDSLPKHTIVEELFGNLKIDATYNSLDRISIGCDDQAGIFAFYFAPETEVRDFIEPLSGWLFTHQYPQLGFLKVDKVNNALLYKFRDGDSNVQFTTDQTIAPIQSSVNVAATQPGDIAVATACGKKKKKQAIRSGLDTKTVKALFSKYDTASLIQDEIGEEIEDIKILKPRITAGSIEVGYRVGGVSGVIVIYPEEIKHEDELIPKLAEAVIADWNKGEDE